MELARTAATVLIFYVLGYCTADSLRNYLRRRRGL